MSDLCLKSRFKDVKQSPQGRNIVDQYFTFRFYRVVVRYSLFILSRPYGAESGAL